MSSQQQTSNESQSKYRKIYSVKNKRNNLNYSTYFEFYNQNGNENGNDMNICEDTQNGNNMDICEESELATFNENDMCICKNSELRDIIRMEI